MGEAKDRLNLPGQVGTRIYLSPHPTSKIQDDLQARRVASSRKPHARTHARPRAQGSWGRRPGVRCRGQREPQKWLPLHPHLPNHMHVSPVTNLNPETQRKVNSGTHYSVSLGGPKAVNWKITSWCTQCPPLTHFCTRSFISWVGYWCITQLLLCNHLQIITASNNEHFLLTSSWVSWGLTSTSLSPSSQDGYKLGCVLLVAMAEAQEDKQRRVRPLGA